MSNELRWRASPLASYCYAAMRLAAGGRLTDEAWHNALAEPAAQLAADIDDLGADRKVFFHQLASLAAGAEGLRDLALAALTKTQGAEAARANMELVAGRIADLRAAGGRLAPRLDDDLALRVDVLRTQWEARGPGLMRQLGKLIEPEIVASEALVAVVHPVCGGGGVAHRATNTVVVEGLLADPRPELPEVLRVGWLVSQLHLDLPRYSERLSPADLERVAPAAMLMAMLASAENVELARCDSTTVEAACRHWQIEPNRPDLAVALGAWWAEYTESRPEWSVALQALAHVLRGE